MKKHILIISIIISSLILYSSCKQESVVVSSPGTKKTRLKKKYNHTGLSSPFKERSVW